MKEVKVTSRLRLLKQLAEVSWGSSQEALNAMYSIYLKPILKYISEVLITTNKSNFNQRYAKTMIVKNTLVTAMQLCAHNLPHKKYNSK